MQWHDECGILYVFYIHDKIWDWWDQLIHVRSKPKMVTEFGRRKSLNEEGVIVKLDQSVPALDKI